MALKLPQFLGSFPIYVKDTAEYASFSSVNFACHIRSQQGCHLIVIHNFSHKTIPSLSTINQKARVTTKPFREIWGCSDVPVPMQASEQFGKFVIAAMGLGHRFEVALLYEGYFNHWLHSTISQKRLKKCIKDVQSELVRIGLDPATAGQPWKVITGTATGKKPFEYTFTGLSSTLPK